MDSDSDDVDQFPQRHASSDKEEVETSSNKKDEAIIKIIQGIPQERCRKEVASSSSSQNDQAIPRRPWKDEASTSQNNANDSPEDEEPDEKEFSRRPGKEPMAADDEELESMLKGLGFTSVLINPFIGSMKEQDDPEEPEIPKSPIMGLVSSSHQITTRPLSVTDEPENPCGSSSGRSLEFPSQINSSAVHDEREIPRRPEEHMASTSGVKEEQEIPMRLKEHVASTSGVKEEEIIPRRLGKEAATTSEVTEEQEIIPRRPGKEAMASTSEGTEEREIFPKRPEKDEKERRRLNTCCTIL